MKEVNTVDSRQEYFVSVTEKINQELDSLQMSYDSKILATALAIRAGHILRSLQAVNAWTQEDVSAVVQGAFADVHEPLETPPKIITLNNEQRLS